MAGAAPRLRDERRVMVRVILGVQRVVVQEPMRPVVDELRGAHVQQHHRPKPAPPVLAPHGHVRQRAMQWVPALGLGLGSV